MTIGFFFPLFAESAEDAVIFRSFKGELGLAVRKKEIAVNSDGFFWGGMIICLGWHLFPLPACPG